MNYQSGYSAPPLSPINKKIIIALVTIFVLNGFLSLSSGGLSLNRLLALNPELVKSGYIWQLFTYPLANSGLMGMIFGCLIIWFVGSELEFRWNRQFYIKFLALSTLITGVFYFIMMLVFSTANFPLMGFYGITFSLLIAYAIIYPDRPMLFMMIFPMKSRNFCLILIGIEFYLMVMTPQGLYSAAHLLQCALALFFLRDSEASYFFDSMKFKVKAFFMKSKALKKGGGIKRNRHLFVVKDEDDENNRPGGPKYFQ